MIGLPNLLNTTTNLNTQTQYKMNESKFFSNEQLWAKIIVAISVAVPVLVTILFYVSPPQISTSFNLKVLPKFHAFLNGSVTILLLMSWYFIKNNTIKAHKAANVTALILSATFLVSYVTYHTLTESTKFGGEGFILQKLAGDCCVSQDRLGGALQRPLVRRGREQRPLGHQGEHRRYKFI